MKLFQCQCCGQVLHFENSACLRCGHNLGYLPERNALIALEPGGEAEPGLWSESNGEGAAKDSKRWRFCINRELGGCNWLLPALAPDAAADEGLCPACQHNRTIPDLSNEEHRALWQEMETAKRRMFYTLIRLGLPRPAPGDNHPEPMIFDFKADEPGSEERVLTGHADGVVTINLIEADDAERERMRSEMGEAYRTLLGHFRHEIGHYYWDILVRDGGETDSFRAVFGDESVSYAESLQHHYEQGAPAGWEQSYVSSYATMHPWEDWAETWAHYLHMVDTLETAASFGMEIDPGVDEDGELSADIDFNPYRVRKIARLTNAWMPLTVAMNAMARSMGQQDIYPFVLPQPVQDKLGYVHNLVRTRRKSA